MQELKECTRCHVAQPESAWHPSQWVKAGRWCRACMKAYYREKNTHPGTADDAPRPCSWCQRIYTPKIRQASWFCSSDCRRAERSARERAERLAAKPERTCLQCGARMPASMRIDATFCSPECNEWAHRLKRSLRTRGGGNTGYVRAQIAERDGWRCGICRRRVDPTLRYPDPKCPSLDHILPVSEGGTSDPANLRLTHLICNVRRRDRGGHEQLALI